jgi:BirA family biotin operon repressor/biotin-[acetyl-CoA-carboxylase] ligase
VSQGALARFVRLGSVGSTNDEAKRLAADGATAGTVVTAKAQIRGRGRRGAAWQSPAGNLHMSAILRPGVPASEAAQLGFVAAVAVAEAIDAVLPGAFSVRLKWPNDVLLEGRKLAGILLEAESSGAAAVDFVIVGIGVNVAAAPRGTPRPATSLAEAGAAVTADDLSVRIAEHLIDGHDRWHRHGFAPVRAGWLARAYGLGSEGEVNLDNERFAARFLGLDETGGLIAELRGGARRVITSHEGAPAARHRRR